MPFQDKTPQQNGTNTIFKKLCTKKILIRYCFQFFAIASMTALFLWQTWDTVVKYRLGYTTMQVCLMMILIKNNDDDFDEILILDC